MPRLFTGIDVPADIRRELELLRQPMPGTHWIAPENYHVTLRFVGDISPSQAHEFADALAHIDQDVFSIRMKGLGVFGHQEPHTLWAGLEPSPQLDDLARAHDRAARLAGLPRDARTFKAHVTLARLRYPRPEVLARFLEHKAKFQTRAFPIERFVLFSSKPGTGGGPYAVEEVFPLRGAPPVGLDWV
jgi:2'-5' RNA ligase